MSSFCLLETLYLGLANFAQSSCRIWACGMYGTQERCTQVLVGRLEGMRLGRPGDRLEDNIKMALQELGWVGIYWIDLA